MAIPVQFNSKIDKNVDYVFDWEFTEDDETPIDVSAWSFNFLLKDSSNVTVWNIVNADFSRPTTSRISFTKTISDLSTLSGLYSISLLVTKTGVLNDQYVYGYYQIGV